MAVTIFAANGGPSNNTELWITDGTVARTTLLKEIRAGSDGSSPSNYLTGSSLFKSFAVLNGFAYFSADDGTNGPELWRSDGTSAGTTMFASVAGASGYSPNNIVTAGSNLFFLGIGASGYGIYKTNGVAAPTVVTTALVGMTYMAAAGNNVDRAIDDGLGTSGLYTSDGGAPTKPTGAANGIGLFSVGSVAYYATSSTLFKVVGGTATAVQVAAVNIPGVNAMSETGGTVFLTTRTNKLYTTTTAGTTATLVKESFDISTAPPNPVAINSKLVFVSTNAGQGTELWVSDGTTVGTVVLKDLVAGATSGNPKNLTKVGNLVYFQASDGNSGLDLWKTDGTVAGTVLVKHIASISMGNFGPVPPQDLSNLSDQNGVLMFSYDDGVHGAELWRSDGTAAGTLQVRDINTALVSDAAAYQTMFPFPVATVGGSAFFVGQNLAGGYELWSSDGTQAGTGLMKDINLGAYNSMPGNFTTVGSKFFFTATDPAAGTELWVSDGTNAGTVMVKDIKVGAASSSPSSLFAIGSKVYFGADNGTTGFEPWVSDGTNAGTFTLGDLNPGSDSGFPRGSGPYGFTQVGANIFFSAMTNADGAELWVTDGTAGAGTHLVKNINPTATQGSSPNGFTAFNSKVYFSADDGASGTELWMSDGTLAGTVVVQNINTTAGGGSFPGTLNLVNGRLIFTAYDGTTGDLWVHDGIATGKLSTGLTNMGTHTVAGSNLFFSAMGPTGGQELYVTNGTAAPTLIDIVAGATGSNPQHVTALGSNVLFSAQNSTANGTELWISNGTLAGTTMVKNINPTMNASSNPSQFMAAGSKVFFIADDGSNGNELWVSDGTSVGTQLVKNIGPLATGGSVQPLKASGDRLLFMANDGATQSELWMTDGTLGGTFRVTDVVMPSASYPIGFTSIAGITLGAGPETLIGSEDDDFIDGLGGEDSISGLGGNDILIGGAANDLLNGDAGNDTGILGDGLDTFNGGADIDTASLATFGAAIWVKLTHTIMEVQTRDMPHLLSGTWRDLANLSGVENVVATNFDDELHGDGGVNNLMAGLGNDLLGVSGGVDTLDGGGGTDTADFSTFGAAVWAKLTHTPMEVQTRDTSNLLVGTWRDLANLVNVENVIGTAFSDELYGNSLQNVLSYAGGLDLLDGDLGVDTADFSRFGAAVWVKLSHTPMEAQTRDMPNLFSGTWRDAANLVGIENVVGSAFADQLFGDGGVNRLTGGLGNDLLAVSGGIDILDGGADSDTADFSSYGAAIWAKLTHTPMEVATRGTSNLQVGTWTDVADLVDVENVIGTAFSDELYGNSQQNVLSYTGGVDLLDGDLGVDTADFSKFGAAVWVKLTHTPMEAQTRDMPNLFSGTWRDAANLVGIENVIGSDYADQLFGDGGVNNLMGGGGNDLLSVSGGLDTLDGGGDVDTADFSTYGAAIWAKLTHTPMEVQTRGTSNLLVGPWSDVANLMDVENVIGTAFSDELYGNALENTFVYTGGLDLMDGDVGFDTADFSRFGSAIWVKLTHTPMEAQTRDSPDLLSGTWRDVADLIAMENVVGTDHADLLSGNSAANRLTGGSGNDVLGYTGGIGIDVLDGGAGVDTADFSAFGSAVWVKLTHLPMEAATRDSTDLLSGTWRDVGDLVGVENVTGTAYADEIGGDALGNEIVGGLGNDLLTGSGGPDWFIYKSINDGNDTITDFTRGAGNDSLRIGEILAGQTVNAGNISDYVQLTEIGGSTSVAVDVDGTAGGAGMVAIALLQGQLGLSLNDMLAQGNLAVS